MNRILKFILDFIVYGFFAVFVIAPLACVIYEIAHFKFEATPFILAFMIFFGAIYYYMLRESRSGIRECEALATRYGIKFSYSKGYLPKIMYWPTFSGTYLGRVVHVWFRGRQTTAVAVVLSQRYQNVGIDLKHKDGAVAFKDATIRASLEDVAKKGVYCTISACKLTLVIYGIPGKRKVNEAIGKRIEELVALAAVIDA